MAVRKGIEKKSGSVMQIEEEVYDRLRSGDISRDAALIILLSYGDRRVAEALEEIKMTAADIAEVETVLLSCIEKLDQVLRHD